MNIIGGRPSAQPAVRVGESDSLPGLSFQVITQPTKLKWTGGVGTDVKLTPNTFARLEYRYTDLGSETYEIGGADFDVDATSHKVLVGFGVSF